MYVFDYEKLGDEYFEDIGNDIWIMDNHKWAFYAWEKYSREKDILSGWNIFHVDYHWDSGDDIEVYKLKEDINNWSVQDIEKYTSSIGLGEFEYGPIRWDSFIAPFAYLKRIKEINWLCQQDDPDEGFSDSFTEQHNFMQHYCKDSQELSNCKPEGPLIFDLCLDYFSSEGDGCQNTEIWKEEAVKEVIVNCKQHLQEAKIVTISISHECFEIEGHPEILTNIVVPMIQKLRIK